MAARRVNGKRLKVKVAAPFGSAQGEVKAQRRQPAALEPEGEALLPFTFDL
jgi:hypothetical protein